MSDSQAPFATLGNAIGFITKLTGSVTIQSIDGQERVVKIGDAVFFGETVVTGSNSSVTIAFVDGTEVVIGGDSVVEITDEIYNTGDNEDLVADSSTDVDALQDAILAGDDPTLVQEAPAAGETLGEQQRVDVDIDRNDNTALPTFGNDSSSALPKYGYDTSGNGGGQANQNQYSAPSSSARTVIDVGGSSAVNQAPIAEAKTDAVTEDASITGIITASDVDQVDANLKFTTTSTVAGLTLNSNGVYTFDASSYDNLKEGEELVLEIPVTVTDDNGATDTTTLTITVTGTNDAPIAEAKTDAVTEDASITGTINATDVDLPVGASLTFSTTSTAAGLTLNADGSYSFDASAYDYLKDGEELVLEIPVTVTDDRGATDTTTLTITINGTDDKAVITGDDSGSVKEDTTAQATGTLSVSDTDAGEATFVAQTDSAGTYGTFSVDAAGKWTYNLTANDSAAVQSLGD
ncbi:MAG: retention module-containing protein, partial [Gammaproteobacteria bacterium]|nr:retention module-containing protein [Gammaproteobacteria bacterium]